MKHCRKPHASLIFLMAIFVCLFLQSARAASLGEYKIRIQQARASLGVLLSPDEESLSLSENQKYRSETLERLRQLFPATETIAWRGGETQINNAWILDRLKNYDDERDQTKRAAILHEIAERLSAVESKLNEVEGAAVSGTSKNETKQKLANILNRPEYQRPEEKKENLLQRKWRELQEWIDGHFPKPKMGTPNPAFFQSFSQILQIIIFAVVLSVIGFVLYRFAPFLRSRFALRERKDARARVILGEHLAEDETSQNLFAEAERLASEGNLRAAIRKGYIALLCELSDRKLIGLAQHKTNRDYLRDVRKKTELHQDLKNLTGSFERHWYGFDLTEPNDWEEFKQNYRQTIGKAR